MKGSKKELEEMRSGMLRTGEWWTPGMVNSTGHLSKGILTRLAPVILVKSLIKVSIYDDSND